jgi:hypothetical protein
VPLSTAKMESLPGGQPQLKNRNPGLHPEVIPRHAKPCDGDVPITGTSTATAFIVSAEMPE